MLSIILPTYNEADSIIVTIKGIAQVLKRDYEIVVVDDDSPDGTAAVVRRYAAKHPEVRLLVRKGERGLSSAIAYGFTEAHSEIVGVMDADGQHDPRILPQMVQAMRDHDLVIGSRYVPGGGIAGWRKRRRLASKIANGVAHLILGGELHDAMAGYFLVRRSVFERVRPRLKLRGYKILLEIWYQANRMGPLRMQEIGFTFRPREKGKSKVRVIWMALEYLYLLVEMRLGGKSK